MNPLPSMSRYNAPVHSTCRLSSVLLVHTTKTLHSSSPFPDVILSSRPTEEIVHTQIDKHLRTPTQNSLYIFNIITAFIIAILLIQDTAKMEVLCVFSFLCIIHVRVCVSVYMCLCAAGLVRRGFVSVGLVGGKQRSIHRLHARGAGEGSHQPVVDTVHVVDVHAGQEPDRVSVDKVHHTDDTLSDLLLGSIPSRVVHALWEVLDKPDALSDSDLLLFGQLSDQSGLAGRWMVDRHMDLLLIGGRWLLIGISTISVAGPVRLRFM